MRTSLGVAGTLLPFAVLFSAFLIFKLDAFRASLSAWIVELVLVLVFYRMPFLKSLEASVWGNLSMWTGFLVLYTGQIFGQAYRSTGLLEILLESIRSMLPSRDVEGRSVALVTLVAGFIGALKVALIVVSIGTRVARLAGNSCVIVGPAPFKVVPVVKVHGLGTAPAISALPLRSLAAFEIVTWIISGRIRQTRGKRPWLSRRRRIARSIG